MNDFAEMPSHPQLELEHDDGTKKTQATILIELGERHYLFHDENSTPYVIFDGRECVKLESKSAADLLQRAYYELTGKGANRNAMSDAISTLAAKALYTAPQEPVFLRVAHWGNNIYIDLGDDSRRVIEITPSGWDIVDQSPVHFERSATMKALDEPRRGGSFDLLREFANVDDEDWPLIYGFVLGCFAQRGPYFHLALVGEQGTSKSTLSRMIRALVDPSYVPLKQPPKDEEQLLVSAQNNLIVAFDNMSGVKPEVSDGLCRLSTGGGFSKRKLYTDADEFVINVQRPAILNGIDDIATRPDLVERSITLTLRPVTSRKLERELWEVFDAVAPAIVGAICNALACGLAYEDATHIDDAPRMADAATWIQACEMNHDLTVGAFVKALSLNQRKAVVFSLESNPVTMALVSLMEHQQSFTGTPVMLLERLSEFVDEDTRRSRAWPKGANWLMQQLRRYGKPLRQFGIDITSEERTALARPVTIGRSANYAEYRHYRHTITDSPAGDGNDDIPVSSHAQTTSVSEEEDWI